MLSKTRRAWEVAPNKSELRRSVEIQGELRHREESHSLDHETSADIGITGSDSQALKSFNEELDQRDHKLRQGLEQVQPALVQASNEECEINEDAGHEAIASEKPPGAVTPVSMVPPGAAKVPDELSFSPMPKDPVVGVPVPVGGTSVVWRRRLLK